MLSNLVAYFSNLAFHSFFNFIVAHEHKLGCIIGRDKNDVLYGIDRNQITYLKYNQRFGEYFAITEDDVPGSLIGDVKDLSDANYVEMNPTVNIDKKHELQVDSGKFAGKSNSSSFSILISLSTPPPPICDPYGLYLVHS